MMALSGAVLPAQPAPVPQPAAPTATARNYDEAKIQIRLPNGKALVQVIFQFAILLHKCSHLEVCYKSYYRSFFSGICKHMFL